MVILNKSFLKKRDERRPVGKKDVILRQASIADGGLPVVTGLQNQNNAVETCRRS